jgi:hypothetical protein
MRKYITYNVRVVTIVPPPTPLFCFSFHCLSLRVILTTHGAPLSLSLSLSKHSKPINCSTMYIVTHYKKAVLISSWKKKDGRSKKYKKKKKEYRGSDILLFKRK